MDKSIFLFFVTATCLFLNTPECSFAPETESGLSEEKVDDVNLTMYIFKNSSEDWLSSFYAEKRVSNSTAGLIIDLKHSVVKRGPDYVIRVKGTLRAENYVDQLLPKSHELLKVISHRDWESKKLAEDNAGKLRFHEKKGRNAVLLNDRRTVYRNNSISDSGYSAVTTDRPLKDDELFQVRLDSTIDKHTSSGVYIGVTLQLADDIESLNCFCTSKIGTWLIFNGQIKQNYETIKNNYPLTGLNLKPNDRIGVMKRKNSRLHFFLNGEDMGEAAKNVPGPVYGFVDVVNYVTQLSIVD